jgi:protein TonB
MSAPAELTIGSSLSGREASLWAAAGIVMLLAHAAFGYVFHAMTPFEPETDATEQALVIELAPLPVSTPDAVESEAIDEVEPPERLVPVEEVAEAVAEEPETIAAVAPSEQAAEVRPEELTPVETEAVAPEMVEPDAVEPEQVEPARLVESVEPEPVQPEPLVAEAITPEELQPVTPEPLRPIEPEAFVETEMAEVVESQVVLPLPEPKPILRPVEKVEAPKKPAPAKLRKVEQPKPRKEVARAEARPAPKSKASQKAQASKAPTVSPARWQSKVLAWINRHKRYPKGARSRGEQGTVRVSFAINSSGSIVSARVTRSSGNAELDGAALDMVRRASPVPAPPPEIAGSRLNLSLPVRFDLR